MVHVGREVTINRERLELGVAALRSGLYKQGLGWLKTTVSEETTHCCLGVLCEVAIASGVPLVETVETAFDDGANHTAFDGNDFVLPKAVIEWYGFENNNPELLSLPHDTDNCYHCSYDLPCSQEDSLDAVEATGLNDDYGWTFEQIAEAFEETFLRAN